MCFEYILVRSTSLADCNEVTTALMLASIINDISHLISTIRLLKVLTLCYLVQLQTLVVIYKICMWQ